LDRLVAEPLRLAPSPSRVARHPSGILTATIQLGHFRIDLAGHLHLMLGLFPLALLDALKLALAMKHIKPHGARVDRLCLLVLGLSLTLLIGQLHPFLKTRAAIGNDVLKTWPLLNDLAPTLAAAIWTALARQPSPARGFDTHQDGIAMKEDFVQTPHPHQPWQTRSRIFRMPRDCCALCCTQRPTMARLGTIRLGNRIANKITI